MVCDVTAMRQFANAPEAQLSSRAAVSDFGFLDTLGWLNVVGGSAAHKLMLKNHLLPTLDTILQGVFLKFCLLEKNPKKPKTKQNKKSKQAVHTSGGLQMVRWRLLSSKPWCVVRVCPRHPPTCCRSCAVCFLM
jgi:hypothetical protein